MNHDQWKAAQAKARRQTIFTKDGLAEPGSLEKRSICNVHLDLAQKISKDPVLSDSRKVELLLIVNEAYNLGKRMAAKLDFYGAEKMTSDS